MSAQSAKRANEISPGLQRVRENSFCAREVEQVSRIQPAKRALQLSPARECGVKWDQGTECRRHGTVLTHTLQPRLLAPCNVVRGLRIVIPSRARDRD